MLRQQPPLLRVNGAWDDFSVTLGFGFCCGGVGGLRFLPLCNVLRSCLTLLITKGKHAACLAEVTSPKREVSYATLVLTEALTPRSAACEWMHIG